MYDGVRRRCRSAANSAASSWLRITHHPTEIESTLEAARWIRPNRIIAVFQPHLFSRTKFFCDRFAEVLATVDRAIVTDIYPSREQPMPGVDSGLIVDAARQQGAENVQLVNDMFGAPGLIAGICSPAIWF